MELIIEPSNFLTNPLLLNEFLALIIELRIMFEYSSNIKMLLGIVRSRTALGFFNLNFMIQGVHLIFLLCNILTFR